MQLLSYEHQECEDLEQQYHLQNAFDVNTLDRYHQLTFSLHQPQRFFATLIKYNTTPVMNDILFRMCCHLGQKQIYEQYGYDYFLNKIHALSHSESANFNIWQEYIELWVKLHRASYDNVQGNPCILALNFICSLHYIRIHKLHDIYDKLLNHPIYSNAINQANIFLSQPNDQQLYILQQICEQQASAQNHWQNYQDDINDPWVLFLHYFKQTSHYQQLEYHIKQLAMQHNIDISNKVLFGLPIVNNIGDNILATQAMVEWSQINKVPIIAILHHDQNSWLNEYFGKYFDDIIIRDKFNFPNECNYIPVAPNNIVTLTQQGLPTRHIRFPFKQHYGAPYFSATRSCGDKFNLSAKISPQAQQRNQKIFDEYNLPIGKTVVISPESIAMDMFVRSNHLLKNFWQQMIIELQSAGFTPILNMSNTKQHIIEHHIPKIHPPLSDIVSFVNQAGFFIGDRSGLCDLIRFSQQAQKYCIYPIEYIDWCDDLANDFIMVPVTLHNVEKCVNDIIASMQGKKINAFENQQCYGYLEKYPLFIQ